MMVKLTTASVGLAVTPTIIQTLLSHYTNRKPHHHQPTEQLFYHEGLQMIRSFIDHASQHTVEDLQAFTSQWVPNPTWVRVKEATVSDEYLARSAEFLVKQLGPDGLRRVGGTQWWQWRKPESPLRAEWIEMQADYNARKKGTHSDPSAAPSDKRIILYIHGGAYYFGSVDAHRHMLQRHARKLKARVFALRYRLSPQFPFPCGLHDCLAAYLHLLAEHEPSSIVLAGDSAGGGMVLSMLVTMRDQGIPLPAGGVLISPWCDLTHSFPSVSAENPLDYIPDSGFHHRPSRAWPPLNEDDLAVLRLCAEERRRKEDGEGVETKAAKKKGKVGQAGSRASTDVAREVEEARTMRVEVDGKEFVIKEQIQMYTTNDMLLHPLVSPAMQPTLGGLPPLLIIAGGGEMLRDEQIYLAHKCANPKAYLPPDSMLDDAARAQIERYGPTDVQLQVWDNLCHVAPTLSFTRPAKHMFRSIAQFSAWALARAQHRGVDILADDDISVISSSDSGLVPEDTLRRERSQADAPDDNKSDTKNANNDNDGDGINTPTIGKAGDPLPPFQDHMIRQRVTHNGAIHPLCPPEELPGCAMPRAELGVIRGSVAKKWLARRRQWDMRYAKEKARVQEQIIEDLAVGLLEFGPDERPPPSALAARRRVQAEVAKPKKTKSVGMALWSLWGSKHDEMTLERGGGIARSPSTRVVKDEQQTEGGSEDIQASQDVEREQDVAEKQVVEGSQDFEGSQDAEGGQDVDEAKDNLQGDTQVDDKDNPDGLPQGVTGKRVFIEGIAMPFSLGKKAETASMLTLLSGDRGSEEDREKDEEKGEEKEEEGEEKVDKKGGDKEEKEEKGEEKYDEKGEADDRDRVNEMDRNWLAGWDVGSGKKRPESWGLLPRTDSA